MKMKRPILEVRNVFKKFGNVIALENISFDVYPNEILGLLGPNGAGKTTIISIILGVLKADMGNVFINEVNILEEKEKVLKNMNFFATYAPLPGNLTVYENLYFYSLLYGIKKIRKTINRLIRYFNLEKVKNVKAGLLSSGEQTRLGLAKAFLNSPKLLLLDEPTAFLDPSVASDVRHFIKEYVRENKCGILWTSHNMREVEEVCDRVIFLSRGKILLEGDPKSLPDEYGMGNLEELFISLAKEPVSLKM
ncbi:MAG: ABC transporter ATP-binding protein [candidate division WOR-3 bacterium]